MTLHLTDRSMRHNVHFFIAISSLYYLDLFQWTVKTAVNHPLLAVIPSERLSFSLCWRVLQKRWETQNLISTPALVLFKNNPFGSRAGNSWDEDRDSLDVEEDLRTHGWMGKPHWPVFTDRLGSPGLWPGPEPISHWCLRPVGERILSPGSRDGWRSFLMTEG